MKTFIYLFISSFILWNCASEKPDAFENFDGSHLVGKWKLEETFISNGGEGQWVTVNDGEEYVFLNNGTFTSNKYSECFSGQYFIEGNSLLLQYNCNDFETDAENEAGFITFNLKLNDNYFIATPTSGFICVETCKSKYIKDKKINP